MRRLLVALVVAVALTAGAVATTGGGGTPSGTYRVDAIFDSAAFLVKGSVVKISGAEVGSIKDVRLTDDLKARVEMEVDQRFAPFRADADCTIQPESLIGERFVQCTPGTPAAGPLAKNGGVPTVPVSGTHTPIDVDLVLTAAREPQPQRLALILNELGTGLAGRSQDLNQALRRSAPALGETNRVLDILDRDKNRIDALVTESDTLLTTLAGSKGKIGDFVESAKQVTETTADRQADLRSTIRNLPGFARELRPALADLNQVAANGEPILTELKQSAPQLDRLAGEVVPFSKSAKPALDRLSDTAATGRRTVRSALPVAHQLNAFTKVALPASDLLQQLTASLRESGSIEGLLRFIYYGTAATARFDSVAHILPAFPVVSLCALSLPNVRIPSCAAQWGSFHDDKNARASHKAAASTPSHNTHEDASGSVPPANEAPNTPAPAAPAQPEPATPAQPAPTDSAPSAPAPPSSLDQVLDFLLGP